jgi:para-nitrobenzyl esterase
MRIAFLLVALTLTAHAQLDVKTQSGRVHGSMAASGDVRQFLGIPYAAPPIGDLRWKAPQPAAPWQGTREAMQFGHHCVQFTDYKDMIFRDPGPSEDCLTLNVWAPAGAKRGSLPVMVWIYGGGLMGGAASESRQDGQFLARHGVLVVSMNYRLGMLGFLTSPELSAESPHHVSGNYGLLDQAAAVAWVARNIAAFGGNPKNITLFGESAGSQSVSVQMASPLTIPLLAHAIGESGSGFYHSSAPYIPLAQRETRDMARTMKVLGTQSIAELRKIPANTLASTPQLAVGSAFPPTIDGWFLPDTLANIYAQGRQAHIPLLAGFNADEVRGQVTFAKVQPTAASFIATVHAAFGPDAEAVLKAYPANTDAEAVRSAGDLTNDRFISFATWRWLDAQVATGHAAVYRYYFALPAPADKYHPLGAGAYHSDDIGYVFGTLDSREGMTVRDIDRKLSGQVQLYWTNYAKTGNPNGAALPQWPTYGPPAWQVMHLDADPHAEDDNLRQRYLTMQSLWMK